MRSLLQDARARNSRMTAAAIGSHLSTLTRESVARRGVGEAADAVRDASLRLLTAVNQRSEVGQERGSALRAVAALEAVLVHDEIRPATSETAALPQSRLGRVVRTVFRARAH